MTPDEIAAQKHIKRWIDRCAEQGADHIPVLTGSQILALRVEITTTIHLAAEDAIATVPNCEEQAGPLLSNFCLWLERHRMAVCHIARPGVYEPFDDDYDRLALAFLESGADPDKP